MKNCLAKLKSPLRFATIIAIFVVLVFMITPVSASSCHPGFVIVYPSSYSIQYSQPAVSSLFVVSPGLNQASTIQFSRPSFLSNAPDFLINGKSYTSYNPFNW